MFTYHINSGLGGITLAGGETALTGLWFDGQKYFGSTIKGKCEEKLTPVFQDTMRWLDIYFSGKNPGFIPPVSFDSTPFRRAVWDVLLSIPYGTTVTYSDIAEKIAARRGISSMSAQAIGGAVGHNPISVIVPCHRVVGKSGCLTGYAGGIDKKLRLLQLEGVDVSKYFMPKK